MPDEEQISVEWYITDKTKLGGVEAVRESWVPRAVGPARMIGYGVRSSAGGVQVTPDPKPVKKPKKR